jgi:hypothetical protein
MKNLSIFFVTLMVIVFLSAVESNAERIGKRDVRQHERIEDGIEDGSITIREAKILSSEQHRIDNQKDRAMRDGHLSKRERMRLEQRQDLANRHIYRMRHNDTSRCDRDYYDDDISFRKSAVVVPILLPPLPPLPLVFPGMHIRIFSSR